MNIGQACRTASNYRAYSDTEVHVLRFIKHARSLGFGVGDITELQSMLRTLEHLASHCHGDQRPECPILDELAR